LANDRRSAEKEAFWREVFRRQPGSGLSAQAFCRRERLAPASFYAWRRILAERDGQRALQASVRVATAGRTSPAGASFRPVVVRSLPTAEGRLVLELAQGRALHLPASMPIEHVAQLIIALEAGGGR
jgi:hypothetical protein